MKFSKLTIGSGSTMEQIIEGEFEIQAIEYGDNKTVPMFVGVRGKRSFGSLPARTRESLIAIPVGGVSIAEIMVEAERSDESLDVPDDVDGTGVSPEYQDGVAIAEMEEAERPGREWVSHWHGGMQHAHFASGPHDHAVTLGEAAP